MPDEPDPSRKFYGFKPREFETANAHPAPPPSDFPAPAPDPGIVTSDTGRIDVKELNRLAATGLPLLAKTPVPVRETEVHDVLRENLAVANAAGLNDVKPNPGYVSPQQRRVRILWLIVFAFDLPLGVATWWIGHNGQAEAIVFVCLIAAIAFVTGRQIWLTFFLNTD